MPVKVRVVSWNLHGWRDDPAAIRRGLRELRPDVACLQEVYRAPGPLPWGPGTRRGLAAVARECGLTFVAGGRTANGNAVLVSSRVRVVQARAVRLRTPLFGSGRTGPVLAGRRVPVPRVGERRGVVLAQVVPADVGPTGARLLVACTHLDLEPHLRVRQAELVVGLLQSWGAGGGAPSVVAGDLNEQPGGPAWLALARLAVDPDPGGAPTYSARDPHQRIDAILVGGPAEVARYRVGGIDPRDAERATDHLPVVADLLLRPA